MKKFLLAAAAATASFAVPAQGADLARPAPPVYAPPPVIAIFSWTGCYVGGNGGGFWSQEEWFDNTGFFAPGGTSFGTHNANGGLGGVQIGCNYQAANWVFGIQGDYDWVSANASNTFDVTPFGFAPFVSSITNTTKIDSLASVTGRVGYAWGRFLSYVKGGGAWVKDEYTLQAAFFGPGFAFAGTTGTIGSLSNTRGGWTVGVGGEYAFLNWLTGFVEYDYYGFSSQTMNFNCTAAPGCGTAAGLPLATLPIDVKQNINVFKVGLNLKFGAGNFGFW